MLLDIHTGHMYIGYLFTISAVMVGDELEWMLSSASVGSCLLVASSKSYDRLVGGYAASLPVSG